MKKILSIVFFTFISISTFAQINGVGINKDTPQAALDIKSADNNSGNVLRFSTPPSSMPASDNNFVFFVGDPVIVEENTVAYDLRSLTLENFVSKMNTLFPSLNKMTITNSSEKSIDRNSPANNDRLPLDTQLINTNDKIYRFATNENAIEFHERGYYEITAFVGIETLYSFEGDILINVLLKRKGESSYTPFKAAIISRSNNNSTYSIGTGVGSSISFVNEFESGDRIRLQVDGSYRPKDATNNSSSSVVTNVVKILPNGATISATRLSPLVN